MSRFPTKEIKRLAWLNNLELKLDYIEAYKALIEEVINKVFSGEPYNQELIEEYHKKLDSIESKL